MSVRCIRVIGPYEGKGKGRQGAKFSCEHPSLHLKHCWFFHLVDVLSIALVQLSS